MTRSHFLALAALAFPVLIYLAIRHWRKRSEMKRNEKLDRMAKVVNWEPPR